MPRYGQGPGTSRAERCPEQQIIGCRWIDGEVASGQWRYCQHPRIPGKSYCASHYIRSIDADGDREFTAEQENRQFHLTSLPLLDEV
ncbi:MAG: hypothetical protein HOA08_21170 [Rhodospirillaceae bacterium]|nr:hypothetical protein [Rhodospirillaceae bacterium]MBT3491309.1 hypothetical protein [Rhodospirillaceae bacterium]MBT3782000.1 hypothetical protein [Rhodospirillaceae bacterium]MBT3978563.1 hypothetical protein [Rhodospirillaceae bacterium]MBT4169257.1 hypothetical protein [Rhodospirillaceae bacterium]